MKLTPDYEVTCRIFPPKDEHQSLCIGWLIYGAAQLGEGSSQVWYLHQVFRGLWPLLQVRSTDGSESAVERTRLGGYCVEGPYHLVWVFYRVGFFMCLFWCSEKLLEIFGKLTLMVMYWNVSMYCLSLLQYINYKSWFM